MAINRTGRLVARAHDTVAARAPSDFVGAHDLARPTFAVTNAIGAKAPDAEERLGVGGSRVGIADHGAAVRTRTEALATGEVIAVGAATFVGGTVGLTT